MRVVVLFVSLTLAAAAAGASPKTDKVIENVRLPTGFKMEVYSDQVPGALQELVAGRVLERLALVERQRRQRLLLHVLRRARAAVSPER